MRLFRLFALPFKSKIALIFLATALGLFLSVTWFMAVRAAGNPPQAASPAQPASAESYTLDIIKSNTPQTFTVGSGNKYIISTRWISGTTPPPSPIVKDELPLGMTAVGITANDWDCDPVPTSVVFCNYIGALNELGTLPAIVITVNISPSVNYSVVNTATLYITNTETPYDTYAITTKVDSVDLELTKKVSPTYADVNQPVTYTLRILNRGPATAKNIQVVDVLPIAGNAVDFIQYSSPNYVVTGTHITGFSWITTTNNNLITSTWNLIGTLGKGQMVTLTVQATPKSNALGRKLTNTAKVSSSNKSDWDPADNTASAFFYVTGLEITKSAWIVGQSPGVTLTEAGWPILYTIVVHNNSTNPATGVAVTDIISDGLDILSAKLNGVPFAVSGQSVYRSLGTLYANDFKTIEILVRGNETITSTKVITNIAKLTASPGIERYSEVVSTTIKPAANLSVSKSHGQTEVYPNQTLNYKIKLENTGSLTATKIFISDTISTLLKFVSFDFDTLVVTETIKQDKVREWQLASPLAPGSSVQFTITAKVDAQAANGAVITNTIMAHMRPANITETVTETYQLDNVFVLTNTIKKPPIEDMEIHLTVEPSQAKVGESFTFKLNVKNKGTSVAKNVVVVDEFPVVLDVKSKSAQGGSATTPEIHQVVWNIGTLNPNQEVYLTIVTIVNTTVTESKTYNHKAVMTWAPNLTKDSNIVKFRVIGPTLPGTGEAEAGTPLPFWLALAAGGLLVLMGVLFLLLHLWARRGAAAWAGWLTKMGFLLLSAGIGIALIGVSLRALEPREEAPIPTVGQLLGRALLPSATPTYIEISQTGGEEFFILPPTITPTPDRLPNYPIPSPTVQFTPSSWIPTADPSQVTRMVIPALGMDAIVKYVPYSQEAQTWLIGGLKQEVAWMGDTSWPGLGGNTGFAGHVDLASGEDGPFWNLHLLKAGDEIIVYTEMNIYIYQVRAQAIVEDWEMSVLAPTEKPQITLITCTEWDAELRVYLKRLVIFADLVRVEPLS